MINIHSFVNRGIQHAGADAKKAKERQISEALEGARAQWLNALYIDQTRCWMNLGSKQPDMLGGLLITLTLAAICKTVEDGHEDSPQVRIIRGAMSAVEQCATKRGSVVTADDARAISSAVDTASALIKVASPDAIAAAVVHLRDLMGSEKDPRSRSKSPHSYTSRKGRKS